jgi:hypothetical protein
MRNSVAAFRRRDRGLRRKLDSLPDEDSIEGQVRLRRPHRDDYGVSSGARHTEAHIPCHRNFYGRSLREIRRELARFDLTIQLGNDRDSGFIGNHDFQGIPAADLIARESETNGNRELHRRRINRAAVHIPPAAQDENFSSHGLRRIRQNCIVDFHATTSVLK